MSFAGFLTRRVALVLLGAPLLVAATVPHTQSEPRLQPTPPGWQITFNTERRPLSGGTVVGAMMGDPEAPVDLKSIALRIPQNTGPMLCVTVRSRDARLQAKASFDLFFRGEGRDVLLDGIYDPEVTRAFRNTPAKDVVLLAELGSRCDDPSRSVVPAGWGEQALSGNVFLYVNTRAAATVRWASPTGRHGQACSPFTDAGSVAYNGVCTLPPSLLGRGVAAWVSYPESFDGVSTIPFRLEFIP